MTAYDHPLYNILSTDHQQFVDNYCQHRDVRLAIQLTYGITDKPSVSKKVLEVTTIPAVGKLIDYINGEYSPGKQEVVAELWKFATSKRKVSDNARIDALMGVAEMQGYITKGNRPPASGDDLADKLKALDAKYKEN